MTYIPYEPPEPMFNDTLLAYKVIAGPRMAALIEPDRLGQVNKVVTLMAGDRRIKSTLCHVPVGATLTVGRDLGSFYSWLSGPSWRESCGVPELQDPAKLPSWFVEVDGRRVLEVPEHETRPPVPPPPKIPWRQRMRSAINRRSRALADAVAHRLGYHRDGECEGDDGW